MKKLTVVLMAACSMLLVACSSNTPKKTVEKAFDALIDGDYETYVRSLYVEDKSDPEKVEKDIQDLIEIVKRNSEDEDGKVKSYEILNEEQSKTGKWVRITYKLTNVDGTENTSDFYLTKDDTGEWKIQMFGTDRLMDE